VALRFRCAADGEPCRARLRLGSARRSLVVNPGGSQGVRVRVGRRATRLRVGLTGSGSTLAVPPFTFVVIRPR
jgi:hypothetical protein